MMDTFADYILSEEDMASKMEIIYYLSKKQNIFFDKSIVLRVEILRLFLNYSKIDVDRNVVITAGLLCNCKKVDNAQDIETIHSYAKKGAEYLATLGFDKKFCKMCEEINRYSESMPRERESDILELIDNFGGMLLDRPERIGLKPDEALVLLEHRNLKGKYNKYLESFIDFVNFMETINMSEIVEMTAFRRLVKTHYDCKEITSFIQELINNYEPKIDKLIFEAMSKKKDEMFEGITKNPNRSLFSEETAMKIMNHIGDKKIDNQEG
ncbi:MAG: hypothetical protein HUJ68_06615 [Clostridia bacterium]|nr:hypothetical protein [Clostridia bacterium]